MKILHVVHGYPPSIGGSQHLVEKISIELARHYDDDVTVLTTVAKNMNHFIQDDGDALPVHRAGVALPRAQPARASADRGR